MLIESDKRGPKNKLQLLYSREFFYVPRNVYIIGMMNTADRSLAMLDYALRRRFAFVELRPAFDSDGFREYCSGLDNSRFEALVSEVVSLNKEIAEDESLGDGFCIGHSYFCNMKPENCTDATLASIVEYELIPMLKEYWFDEPARSSNGPTGCVGRCGDPRPQPLPHARLRLLGAHRAGLPFCGHGVL